MKGETIILVLIGLSFLGFISGLVARNTGHQKKQTLRGDTFYKYLTAVSVIAFLLLAFLYQIIYS
jgi:hypothetical protein